MLILFDIDMTLLETDHIGIDLLEAAGRELFTPDFSARGVVFGGRLDPVIIAAMLGRNGIQTTPDRIAAMRAHYHRGLREHAAQRAIARALPGALDLVQASRAHRDTVAIGVLTGNFPETGAIKLASAGFDPSHFTINAWGDQSPHAQPQRSHLPPIAIDAFVKAHRAIEPDQVIIIGDTVHDVSCALDSGCRSLAVATGHDTRQALAQAGAHLVADDLTNTDDLVDWMMSKPTRRVSRPTHSPNRPA